jgi:hypothetical protein
MNDEITKYIKSRENCLRINIINALLDTFKSRANEIATIEQNEALLKNIAIIINVTVTD